MAFRYLVYRTDFGNTIVRESPTPPVLGPNELSIFSNFPIPTVQPLYFWRVVIASVVVNTNTNINAWAAHIALPLQADDVATIGDVTGITTPMQNQINGLTGYTATTGLQQVTQVNATTNIESTFDGGLVTQKIRPTGDTVTAIQIHKADGTTAVISIDTLSGLTGFNEVSPQGVVHAYGNNPFVDSEDTMKNAIIIDGGADVDKDIQWAENGQAKWLAETFRCENSNYWYLYNVEAANSPLTIKESGRVGINKVTNQLDYHATQIVGTGLSDILISGTYTQSYNTVYRIAIVANGTPDQFEWQKSLDAGLTFGAFSSPSGVTTTPLELEYGVFVQFSSTTGHVVGNVWEFAAFTQIPQGTLTVAPMGFAEILVTNDYTQPVPVYNDYTTLGNGAIAGGKFTFKTGTGATLQTLTWGTTVDISSVYFNILTGGTNITLVVEFWNGASWIALSPSTNFLIDGTDNTQHSGLIVWEVNTFPSWTKSAIPGDSHPLYWMRLRTSTNPGTALVGRSISAGNDKRFSVYNAFNSYSPAMYVDSIGRVNIGGGNLTGSNKLQVNCGNNVTVTSSGTDSLVEFDSQCSSVTDLKIKLASEDSCGPGLTFVSTRGTLDQSCCTCTGDILGRIDFRGRAGTQGRLLAEIGSQFVGSASTRCADIFFSTANGGNPIERVRISHDGMTGFGLGSANATALIHLSAGTTSYAPLRFTSGAVLSAPQVGAMEFCGNKWFGTTTGGTRQTFAFLDSPQFTGTPNLPSGTTFNGGLATCAIRPLTNGISTLQIRKANNITPIIDIDSISGFTGFGVVAPQTILHTYGCDTTPDDGWNYQKNGLRLDGVCGADKDIQWADNGVPQFSAQIYRCEGGSFWYLSSPQNQINQITVAQSGRIGINNQTNMMNYHAILEIGGPNDLVVGGFYTQNYTSVYEIEIDSNTGVTDTFRWRASTDDGQTFDAWSASSGLTLTPVEIQFGVTVAWDTLTGHSLGTTFIFGAFSQLPVGTFVVTPSRFNEVQQSLNYAVSAITYTDITAEANSSTLGGPIVVFETGTTTNAIYFGTYGKMNSIFANLVRGGLGITLVTEYWNGSTWINITNINDAYVDNTNNLSESGGITWETSSMTGWIQDNLPDLPGTENFLYWIRIRTSTNPTIAPLANSFARGGNYRLAVLTSPSDFKPSFYIDSLGRTNIGGGNMTGCNLFQINPYVNNKVLGGRDNLFEIDSENACVGDIKIKVASNDPYDTGIAFAKTRGTLLNPEDIEYGDCLGHLEFRASIASTGMMVSKIESQYTGNGLTNHGDIMFFAANGGGVTEIVRMAGSGTTGFGIGTPTAVVHLKAGSTTIAPLKFTSGSLLTTPQAGAVEFCGNKWFGTTTGATRCTFAFLESPQFTGNPNLPVGTCLNNQSLCTYILTSGGTNNPKLTTTCQFNAYTASTLQVRNNLITGATNGLTKPDCHSVILGGNLTQNTVLTGSTFDFTISSKALSLLSTNCVHIEDFSVQGVHIRANGGPAELHGNTIGSVEKTKLSLSETVANFTDCRAIPKGIEYTADYSGTYTARSLVDKNYVDTQAGGLHPKAAVEIATLTAITLSGNQTIDGVLTTTGMRVLVKNQASGATNGVYSASTGTWGRTADFDGTPSGEVVNNSYFFVLSGNTNVNTSWILTTPNPIVVGVDDLTFSIFSATNGVTAGNGICVTQSGGNFNVALKLASNCGLCVDSSGLRINNGIAGVGLCYALGIMCLNGIGIAGNSLSWTGTQLAVNISGGTLSTALASKLNTSTFASYSASTLTNINSRLLKTTFSAYTGTTVPGTYETITNFNFYTGTTAPANYYNKTQINSYTAKTQTTLNGKAFLSGATFTGKVCVCTPATNDNSNCAINSAWYNNQGGTATPNMDGTGNAGTSTCWSHSDHIHPSDTGKTNITLFNSYTGTTAPAQFARKGFVSTYTGTTAPNTYLSITNFNTYSGTTVPANYYNKTQINAYSAKTQTTLNAKAYLSGATFTGVVCGQKPAQNDNSCCFATTSWYISQGSTAVPLMDGIAACGTSNLFARQDHVHPRDTSKLSLSGGTMTGALKSTSTLAVSGFISGNTCVQSPIHCGACFLGTTCVCAPVILASTSICSPIISGSTKICSPIICGTSCVRSALVSGTTVCAITVSTTNFTTGVVSGTTCVATPIVKASTCVCTPISCGSTCVIGAITIGQTCVCSPVILGSTSICSPIISGSTKICSPIVCGTSCIASPIHCGTTCAISPVTIGSTCVCSPVILGSTSICSPVITGSTKICSPIVCGTSCTNAPVACGTTCVASPLHCGACMLATSFVCSPVITGSTKICSPTVIATTSLCSAGTAKIVGATTGSTLFLTTTPPTSSIATGTTLFWNSTTKQIESIKLTGGSDSYFYTDTTTNTSTASATCVRYLSGTPWNFKAGRYSIDFNAAVGNSANGGTTLVKFSCDGTVINSNLCFNSASNAGGHLTASLTKDLTMTSGCHCLEIYYWAGANTACIYFGTIRARRIC